MNADQRQQVLDTLWPPRADAAMSVWAVLDGARDSAIHLALMASRLEFRCLYSGRLPRELEIAAPQLVELLPGHRLTETLLEQGWGRSWGVLVKTSDPSNLRHHLRKLLKVEGLAARPVLFRFYDPRVLRAFLPQARPEQLDGFFGPIAAWYAEAESGGLLEYTLERPQRLRTRHAVPEPRRMADQGQPGT